MLTKTRLHFYSKLLNRAGHCICVPDALPCRRDRTGKLEAAVSCPTSTISFKYFFNWKNCL